MDETARLGLARRHWPTSPNYVQIQNGTFDPIKALSERLLRLFLHRTLLEANCTVSNLCMRNICLMPVFFSPSPSSFLMHTWYKNTHLPHASWIQSQVYLFSWFQLRAGCYMMMSSNELLPLKEKSAERILENAIITLLPLLLLRKEISQCFKKMLKGIRVHLEFLSVSF